MSSLYLFILECFVFSDYRFRERQIPEIGQQWMMERGKQIAGMIERGFRIGVKLISRKKKRWVIHVCHKRRSFQGCTK